MNNINMYEVYENWRKGLGRFKWNTISTPFASSKELVNEMNFSNDLNIKKVEDLLDMDSINLIKNLKKEEIIIFDLEGVVTLDLALNLNNHYGVKPILVFAHIQHKNGIVGSGEMLNKLIKYSYNICNQGNNFGLFLDYDRFSDHEYNRREYFNNQYRLTEEEMPYVEDFISSGINKAIIISKNPIKIDLEEYINYLKDSELKVEVHLID